MPACQLLVPSSSPSPRNLGVETPVADPLADGSTFQLPFWLPNCGQLVKRADSRRMAVLCQNGFSLTMRRPLGPTVNTRYRYCVLIGIDYRGQNLSPCIREGGRSIRGAEGSASFVAQPLTSWQTANPFLTRTREIRRSLFLACSQVSSSYQMVSPRYW